MIAIWKLAIVLGAVMILIAAMVFGLVQIERVSGCGENCTVVTKNIYRVIDIDSETVCWVYSPGGIFCLPLSQTGLDQ